MRIPITDLKLQHDSLKTEVGAAIQGVIASSQFILGAEVKAFEDEMAAYLGTKFAVGVASGTDALHLVLLACGVRPGDEVITTPFTFIATVETIVKCGARPVFVDIDPETFNLNAGQIAANITPKTRALLPVHLYGQPADMDRILELGRKYNLRVIEDCAQALGAEYRGRKVGSLGDAGCLSFFPAKNLGALGDGGMVVTSNPEIADTVRMLRAHGAKSSYYHVMHGFNSRLDALQAAVLRVKLKHLEDWNEKRRTNTAHYNRLLEKIPGITTPCFPGDVKSSCNYYTARISNTRLNREELRRHLDVKGIQTAVYYPLSLHLQEVYRDLGYQRGDFPESEKAQDEVFSLPMYPELTREQIETVADEIKKFTGD